MSVTRGVRLKRMAAALLTPVKRLTDIKFFLIVYDHDFFVSYTNLCYILQRGCNILDTLYDALWDIHIHILITVLLLSVYVTDTTIIITLIC